MGRGKRKYDAPLQPNGAPTYQPRQVDMSGQMWSITFASDPLMWQTWWGKEFTREVDPVTGTIAGSAGYSISGEFQDTHFTTGVLDPSRDNPVDAVVREVLGLYPGEELLAISYRDGDGNVRVRTWSGE